MSAGQCPRLYRATFLGMCGTLSRHRIITRRGIMGTIKPSISRNSVLAYYRIVSWRGIPDHDRTISRRGSRTITRPSHGVASRTISKSGIQNHHLIISQPGIPDHHTAWHPGLFHGVASRTISQSGIPAISRPGIPNHLTVWHPGPFHGLASRAILRPGILGHLTTWHFRLNLSQQINHGINIKYHSFMAQKNIHTDP